MRSTLRATDLALEDTARLLRADGFVARARPWPGEPTAVHLVTVDRSVPPSAAALAAWLRDLSARGVVTVRTGALGPTSTGPYLDAGFTVRQELALLTHSLAAVPDGEGGARRPHDGRGARLRRPRPDDLVALAMLDRRAFGAMWGLDLRGIVDACQATPVHRVRVAVGGRGLAVADPPPIGPVGYAITGRAGRSAYLQRLAVDPAWQGHGLGRALAVDALRWARRHRATSMLVNTHVENEPALTLYRRLGFVELGYRLVVLERTLP